MVNLSELMEKADEEAKKGEELGKSIAEPPKEKQDWTKEIESISKFFTAHPDLKELIFGKLNKGNGGQFKGQKVPPVIDQDQAQQPQDENLIKMTVPEFKEKMYEGMIGAIAWAEKQDGADTMTVPELGELLRNSKDAIMLSL